MAAGTETKAKLPHGFKSVTCHPLVLLNVTDHYNRILKDAREPGSRRVVGVLLGSVSKGQVDVANSFAVPFEEDKKDPRVWFIDHNFLEVMARMFKKVTSKEQVIGWYSTGPNVKPADLAIDRMIRRYCANPVFLIVDVRADNEGLPTSAYTSMEVSAAGKETERVFEHLPSEVGAYESEEVGVEHLLRDINDPSVSTVGARVRSKIAGLRGLQERLETIAAYLRDVESGELEASQEILGQIQEIVGLLPNMSVEATRKAVLQQTNDMHMAMYVSGLVASVLALHELTTNKLRYSDAALERRALKKLKEDLGDEEEGKKKEEGKAGEGKEDEEAAAGGGGK